MPQEMQLAQILSDLVSLGPGVCVSLLFLSFRPLHSRILLYSTLLYLTLTHMHFSLFYHAVQVEGPSPCTGLDFPSPSSSNYVSL